MDPKSRPTVLILVLILSCLSPAVMVFADVPTVLVITRVEEGDETFLEVEVRHSSPTQTHYVDVIEVEIAGKVEKIDGLEPQTTTKFTTKYKLEDTGASGVKVRAHCNIHGWSQWTIESTEEDEKGGSGIPGFPYGSIALGLTFATVVTLWARRLNPKSRGL